MENRIGNAIREKRKKMGYSQEKLAELADVTTGFIGQVERGEARASVDVLGRIIVALAIDANTLFYDQDIDSKLEHELTIMLSDLDSGIRGYIIDSIRLAYRRKQQAIREGKL